MKQRSVPTQFGNLTLTEEDGAITRLDWTRVGQQDRSSLLDRAAEQLAAYAAGDLEDFDLPLRVAGTDFQRDVCAAMSAIPFGYTRTYGEIASQLGKPTASRAVGAANGRNPIPLIIPCHRVVGSQGKLTGFAHGLEIKQQLIEWESRQENPKP